MQLQFSFPQESTQKITSKICRVCGTSFRVKPSHAHKRNCCSRVCMGKWQSQNALGYDPKNRIEKKCVVCGVSIFVKKSHQHIEGTYCSRECMSTGYRSGLRGTANPNYRHGQADTVEWRRRWHRQWRKKHPEKFRIWNAQIKAKRRKAEGKFTGDDVAYLMRHQRGKCAICHCDIRRSYHVDHRIPIARGGHNRVGNLQLLCPTCNMRKRTMFMMELRRVAWYLEGRS